VSGGRVLDHGALLAYAAGDGWVLNVLTVLRRTEGRVVVPTTALSAAIASRPAAGVRLALLLADDPQTVVPDELTASAARAVARLLATAGLGADQLVNGHVVYAALSHDLPVLTGDADALRRTHPALTVDAV
jgi:hypothetical protein